MKGVDAMTNNTALIYGGTGREHDVSVMGCQYMKELIEKAGFTPILIRIDNDGAWSMEADGKIQHTFPVRAEACSGFYTSEGIVRVNCAVPLLHGDGGESGEVQGALECAGIPYIGAKVSASAFCLDKHFAKLTAHRLGIPTAEWVEFSSRCSTYSALAECQARLGYPMFIKPRRLGSSVGAYPVFSEDDFKKYFPLSAELDNGSVLVEKMIEPKRELEIAYYSALGTTAVSDAGEVLSDGFYGYCEKYGGKTKTLAKANLDIKTNNKIKTYAKMLSNALGLRHLARIDFFLTDGKILFNEINTFPGFTKESLYPRMLDSMGIKPYEAIKNFILDSICS